MHCFTRSRLLKVKILRLNTKCVWIGSFLLLPHTANSLTNLYNALSQASPLRLLVQETLLDLASAQSELEVFRQSADKWMLEWKNSDEQKSAFLKKLAAAFANADQQYVLIFMDVPFEFPLLGLRLMAT